MATDIKKINNNRDRVLKAVNESSGLLGIVAHKMVVDCEKDDRWLNDPARNQGHNNIGSVDAIRNTMDPSALLSVMLRVLNEHRDYNEIQRINFGFVDKIRKIRNDATHYDAALLSSDSLVEEAIRSVREFNSIIQAAGARTTSPRPTAPQPQPAQRHAPPAASARTASPRPTAPQPQPAQRHAPPAASARTASPRPTAPQPQPAQRHAPPAARRQDCVAKADRAREYRRPTGSETPMLSAPLRRERPQFC